MCVVYSVILFTAYLLSIISSWEGNHVSNSMNALCEVGKMLRHSTYDNF
jgi:hypothetical protein